MSSWVKRLFGLGRKTISAAEWMNRARLTVLAEVPAVYRPRVSMLADQERILCYVYCESGASERVFEFKRSTAPEHAVRSKVRPWIMKQALQEQPL